MLTVEEADRLEEEKFFIRPSNEDRRVETRYDFWLFKLFIQLKINY